MDLKQAIKAQAYRLGFSLVGVTTCDSLPHGDVFITWLESGKHGEMSYLDTPRSRQCRAHPAKTQPGCLSILVLGVRYPAPNPVKENTADGLALRGRIASYAWGNDYHEFLPERLRRLVQYIEAEVGHPVINRWYTDTGPILERELAQRAGLGWIGKNTCLINSQHGSYFLLAEILLGVELNPDQPFTADRCGTCTRCIQACPTGCILPSRTLDARHCISYLTIELKGSIPRELRPLMDSWVFGCDICQQVCPWNRFTSSQVDASFDLRLVQPDPDLSQALALPADKFNTHYRHSPIRRPKRRGYFRNISVALGNSHLPDAIAPLGKLLEFDPEPVVRAHAAWALGQIGGGISQQILSRARTLENDPQVLQEIEISLPKLT